MKLQFFSVNALEPEADQTAIDDFCVRHRLVSVDKRFVDRGEFCYWSVCITYLEVSTSPTKPTVTAINKRGSVDYREVLGEQEFEVFAKLRNLRKVLAEADGVPMYAVFSNAQLAEMVTRQATSLTALAEINGVGTAKLDKYGKHFIAVLKATLPTTELSLTPDSTDETPLHHAG